MAHAALAFQTGYDGLVQSSDDVRAALRAIFDSAVASADPRKTLAQHLPDPPKGRCIVVGAGKSAALMAAALEEAWPHVDMQGVVVTRYGQRVPTSRIEVIEAAHPVPDENSERAARAMLERVRDLKRDDLVLALMSGGGSSLLELPAEGVTLSELQDLNRTLLDSGATIREMNAIRKHFSAIKGGRLAMAAKPASVVTLAISDVPGDDPTMIASGPTLPDSTTLDDVRAIVAHYKIELAPSLAKYLEHAEETPKTGEINAAARLIATPAQALQAAAATARERGFQPIVLGVLEGESRDLGIVMAGIAQSIRAHGQPVAAPAVVLSGGETTVTIAKGAGGKGGRNMEFLLSLAIALERASNVWAIAADTDGIDGNVDAAGAFITPDTLDRAQKAGVDARATLDRHDSYTLFEKVRDLLVTGPTLTNVNALRAVAILPPAES